jgi:opacity protein-like surface antigen
MKMRSSLRHAAVAVSMALLASSASVDDAPRFDYRVLATKKTSTMEKEINEAADAGYVFHSVMGGDTAVGGNESVVVMSKGTGPEAATRKIYKLLATSKTSTMEKEMQQVGDEGFEYRGQTVFKSTFGGQEVVVILELDAEAPARRIEYKLLATSKTSTMQKELQEAGEAGFELVGLTVSKTAFGGAELLCILQREGQ